MKTASGSIDTTALGHFRVRITAWGRRKTIGTYPTREQAELERASALDVLDESDFRDESVSVAEYGEKVLAAREMKGEISDTGSDRGRWKEHILTDAISKMPVRKVKTSHVDAFLERCVEKGMAHQTMLNTLNVLRVIFKQAKRKKVTSEVPCVGLQIPKRPAETVEEWTYLLPDEQRAIVDMATEPERHIIAFAIGAGLRAGELVTLRAADVHLDRPEPHVVVRYGKPPSKPTKGKKIRFVPLFGTALDAARAWAAQLDVFAPVNPARTSRKLRAHKGKPGRVVEAPPERLFFPTDEGHFRDERHVLPRKVWKSLPAAAGITRNVRWHDLRHTCGSSLVSGWWARRWSIEEVAQLLGHTDVKVTQRYAHLGDTALKAAASTTTGLVPPPKATVWPPVQEETQVRDIPLGSSRYPGFEDRAAHQSRLRFQTSESLRISEKSTRGPWPLMADALVTATAAGDAAAAWHAARGLAMALLDVAPVAGEVLAGGPHAIARALDLADLVLGEDAAEAVATRRGSR